MTYKRPIISGVPEQSKFRCEIFLNPTYSKNTVDMLDGYSTMRKGEVIHREAQDEINALTSFARRLISNAYFQYEEVDGKRIFRTNAINFYLQVPPIDRKDNHPLIMQLTPHEFILYGYFQENVLLKERISELYQIIRTGDFTSIKRENYSRKTEEKKDFTFSGKTYDDLTEHCKLLLKKGYDRPRVTAFWNTIRLQYFPHYEVKMTEISKEAEEHGSPEHLRSIQKKLLNNYKA